MSTTESLYNASSREGVLVFSVASKRVSHDFDHDHEHENDHHTTTRFNPTRRRVGSLPQGHSGLWAHRWVQGGHPPYTGARKGRPWVAHNLYHDRRPIDRRQALRQTCFQQAGVKTNVRYNNQVLTATWNLTALFHFFIFSFFHFSFFMFFHVFHFVFPRKYVFLLLVLVFFLQKIFIAGMSFRF